MTLLFALAFLNAPARAQSPASDQAQVGLVAHDAATTAEAGNFLPTTIAPRTDSQTGYVRALGGYDSARRSGQFEALADVTVIGPLAARVGVLYSQRPNSLRPSVGLRVQALTQERFGFDFGVGGYYQPEGFTEAEGEIELVLAFARSFDRLGLFANLVYGQDPDAEERDGELRLAALYTISEAFLAGFDARVRVDLGSEEGKRRAEGGAKYDVVVGPTASYALGPVAAFAQAGASVFGVSPARIGAVALLGLAGAI
jgi:hypothetical protein